MYTNDTNIPLSVAVWLSHDSYDHCNDPYTISTTSLLKPIREIVLSLQNRDLSKSGDVSSLVASSIGTAIHTDIENAWLNDEYKECLKLLGYPEYVIGNIKINPKKEDITKECIPIYLEQRSTKKVGRWTISGKFDFVAEGILEDFKSTGAYSYITGSNDDNYIKQGSIYRWLNPNIITSDYMGINYIFTDWSKLESIKNPKYPKQKILQKKFQLLSIQEIESFITNKLNTIDTYLEAKQEDIPECTDEELWVKPPKYKYYKDPNKTARSTKNFDSYTEAQDRLYKDGNIGIVKSTPKQVTKCKYCNVVEVCKQAERYIQSGELTI